VKAALLALAALCAPAFADTLPLSPGHSFTEQGGAAIFAHVCAACHQADAKGAVGAAAFPALANNVRLGSVDYVESVLLQGQRNMPALGKMMSDAQVADLINYLRTHFGNAFDDSVSEADIARARAAP
jgi:mono/diheme cytochrome c family protein